MQEIEERLVRLAEFLFDQNFREAQKESAALLRFVHSFQAYRRPDPNRAVSWLTAVPLRLRRYTEEQLEKAQEAMRCCSVVHRLPQKPLWPFAYVAILLAGVAVYSLVIFLAGRDR